MVEKVKRILLESEASVPGAYLVKDLDYLIQLEGYMQGQLICLKQRLEKRLQRNAFGSPTLEPSESVREHAEKESVELLGLRSIVHG
jgi:hypothetical protein